MCHVSLKVLFNLTKVKSKMICKVKIAKRIKWFNKMKLTNKTIFIVRKLVKNQIAIKSRVLTNNQLNTKHHP